MPELPEVETVRRGAELHLPGRRLTEVEFTRLDLRWPIPTEAFQALIGSKVRCIDRRSKYLLLRFHRPLAAVALIHLGMSGRLFIDVLRGKAAAPDWLPHEHWRMRFEAGRLLRYVDPRRFGALDFVTEAGVSDHPLLSQLGPEPLSDEFDADLLYRRSRNRKVAVKTFLMDAKNVVGVGNIYASEACFRAEVNPRKAAARLTRPQCTKLAESIRTVLEDAIRAGGTTLRDYVGVDQDTGYFQRELSVYDRGGLPCPRCGHPIRRTVLGQRATFHCANCQR